MFRFFSFFQGLLCIIARVSCAIFRALPLLLVTFQLFWCWDLASKSQQVACVNCGRIVKIPLFGYTFRLAKIEETRSNQEVDLIWSSACLQLNLWLAKFLELIYKNKTMIQITGATISNVLLDDLMLWLSNEYLSTPK